MTTTDARITELYELLLTRLEREDVRRGKLFGLPSFVLDGASLGCIQHARLAVKLGRGTDAHATALALPDATLFDPSGKHRPFRDWVSIPLDPPAADTDTLESFLLDAVALARA